MNSVDLSKTIAPKSDQLNADDLIAGPMTITITQVRGVDGDQPIAVSFEGDNGKPYKPCKSMRRVLVHAWGKEGREYVGKRMTLYCDPEVAFGGVKVGGIRISHISHIDRPLVIPLTVTRAKRSPYEVRPLKAEVKAAPMRQAREEAGDQQQDAPRTQGDGLTLAQRADAYEERINAAPSTVKLKAIRNAGEKLRGDLDAKDPERLVELEELWNTRFAACEEAEREGA